MNTRAGTIQIPQKSVEIAMHALKEILEKDWYMARQLRGITEALECLEEKNKVNLCIENVLWMSEAMQRAKKAELVRRVLEDERFKPYWSQLWINPKQISEQKLETMLQTGATESLWPEQLAQGGENELCAALRIGSMLLIVLALTAMVVGWKRWGRRR